MPETAASLPIRLSCEPARIATPSPRLPSIVEPSARRPIKLPATVTPDAARLMPASLESTSESDWITEPSAPVETMSPALFWKSIVTRGLPLKPGADEPSISSESVIVGRADESEIVPATLKSIASAPLFVLAAMIASRSEPVPESASVLTRYVSPATNAASTWRPSSSSSVSGPRAERLPEAVRRTADPPLKPMRS